MIWRLESLVDVVDTLLIVVRLFGLDENCQAADRQDKSSEGPTISTPKILLIKVLFPTPVLPQTSILKAFTPLACSSSPFSQGGIAPSASSRHRSR